MASGTSSATGILVTEYFDQWLAHVRTRVRVTTWEGYEVLLRRYAGLRWGSWGASSEV